MVSRSIGQSFRRLFPFFVDGDQGAPIDIAAMRKRQAGPLSRAPKDTDKDAIRMAIEDPGHGGPTWIGFYAFERMAKALEDYLKQVDEGGNRPNQINWIRYLNSEAWINAMTPDKWSEHLGPSSKVAKSISARVMRTTRILCDDITSCEALIAKVLISGKRERRALP